MSTQRRGNWMQTYTGRQFWPLDPRPEEIDLEDIAHSLSMQCRFAGHCYTFYSVAEHCVRVSNALERLREGWPDAPLFALMGLMHDASEAYLVDLPRPVKRAVEGYAEAEELVQSAIWHRFGLCEGQFNGRPAVIAPGCAALIKLADNTLLATEARDLMGKPPVPWEALPDPLPETIIPWTQGEARAWFIERFNELQAVVQRG